MVLWTFVPAAVGAQNFQGAIYGEGISQPRPERLLLANSLLPSPMHDALLSMTLPKKSSLSVMPPLKPPVKPTMAFPRNLFSPMPDNSTAVEPPSPDVDMASDIIAQEDRLRLARFLPEDTQYAGLMSTVDTLLSKVLEDRSTKPSEQEKMVLAYLQGEEPDGTDPVTPPDNRTEAEILLDQGMEQLQQQNLLAAATSFFDVVNRFPESEASDTLDTAMNALAWDAERGYIDLAELRQFSDALPDYAQCQSDKAVYWLIAAHQLTGHNLHKAGQETDAQLYLGYARDAALAAMKDIPQSPYQIFVPGHYMLACRDLGKESLEQCLKTLKSTVRTQETNNILKLAARMTLCIIYHRDLYDNVEAALQCYNLLEEFPDSEAARMLDTNVSSPNVLGHIEFALGYIYFQMAQYGTARTHFSIVAKEHTQNYRLAENAAFMCAFLTELIESGTQELGIEAYYKYLEEWPDGSNVEKALLHIGACLDRLGKLSDASATYRQVLTYFPESSSRASVERLANDLDAAVEAGTETQMLVERVSAEYGGNLCGPYALALLMESQGKEADLRILASASGSDATGASLSGLLKAATEAGLTVYAEKVDDIRTLSAPVIAHFTAGHYIFVSAIQTDKIIFEDVSGEQTLSPADFNARISGYVITLRKLEDGDYISQEIMDSIRGGCETYFEDLSGETTHCVNNDYIPPCPIKRGGPGNGRLSLGSQPPKIFSPGSIGVPGSMPDPGNPNVTPNIPFGGGAMSIDTGTNLRGLVITQTDISAKTRASMDFSFQRVYYNAWGQHRDYRSNRTRPFKNNMGDGWIHNFNVHLRSSYENGYVAYIDSNGNFKRFILDEEDVSGYDLYRVVPLDTEGEDTNGLTQDRALLLKRNIANGWYELEFPDGVTCRFSAPINDEERYCRLEWFKDSSGNQITLTYDDLWVETPTELDPDLETNFGQLSRVDAPSGDGRYMRFTYSAGLLIKVELCIGEYPDDEVLQYVEYIHGAFKGIDSTYGYAFLRSVMMNDDYNDVVEFEYEDGVYGQTVTGMYPARIQDKEGNELLMEFEYDYVGGESSLSTSIMTMTFPNDMVMTVDNTLGYTKVITCEDDEETVLSKYKCLLGSHGVLINTAYYYPDPEQTTTNTWTYTYQNQYDLSTVAKINTQYWYDEDTGRALKSGHGATGYMVYYRYEYENVGDLYPYRIYGPGQASDSYKGPMTEFVYDASNRIIQIKPPNMGSNGISITYDAYGQVTERENAASNSETFTYDDQGNMTSHTDYEDNTTSYVYNELGNVVEVIHPNSTQDPDTRTHYEYEAGGCSCSGGSGQVTSITLPGGAEMLFDYDKNGNLILQTDPLGHETAYEYDCMGNLVSITTEEDRVQTYEYDLLGNMIASTDFEGKVTKYEYDYRGLMTKTYLENDPGTDDDNDVLVQYEYDDIGQVVKVIDGKEQEINFTYNSRGQVTRTSHGDYVFGSGTGPIHIYRDYNSYGRLIKERACTLSPVYATNIDPIEYTYNDTTGQLTQKTYTNYDPINQQNIIQYVDYEYDDEGRMIIADDWFSRGMQTDGHEFAYNDNGRLLTYTDYDGAELNYTYDNMGRVAAMDAYETNNSYEYDYNVAGQLDTLTAPGSKEWAFTYDDAGRITSYTWPNGMSTHYTYDGDGRLTGIQHKDSTAVEEGWAYTLNEGGNIRHVANVADDNDSEAWEYYYDSRDRLTEALQRGVDSAPEACYVYAYDQADNMTSKIKYDAEVYNRFYDTDTYIPWVTVSGTWQIANGEASYYVESGTKDIYAPHNAGDHEAWFSFKRVGQLDNWTDGFRVRLRNIDANNYLDVRWAFGMTVVEECVSGTPTVLTALENVGDEEGVWYDVYVQLEDDAVVMYAGIRGEEMVKVVDDTTGVAASTDRIEFLVYGASEFHFDDVKVMQRDLGDQTMAMTYDDGNQLTNIVRADGLEMDFSYNAWGRLSHVDLDFMGLYTFTMDVVYECGSMLKRIETDFPAYPEVVEFFTDGLGRRRYKLVPDETLTCYRWDAGYNVLTEYVDDTGQWNAPDFTRFFVPMGHTAFAEGVPDGSGDPAAGTYNYLAHDHLGTGRFAYDQAKDQIGMVEHDPYGERTNQTGYVPYHEYTGKPFDEETGMYYFPFRYYHPHLARWTTPDPAGLVDGPNVYGYVGGNVTNVFDNLGLVGCRGCGGGIRNVKFCDDQCFDLEDDGRARYRACWNLSWPWSAGCKKWTDSLASGAYCPIFCDIDQKHCVDCSTRSNQPELVLAFCGLQHKLCMASCGVTRNPI